MESIAMCTELIMVEEEETAILEAKSTIISITSTTLGALDPHAFEGLHGPEYLLRAEFKAAESELDAARIGMCQ